MVQRHRRGFSAAERTELWDQWQRGESLRAIGRAFGKSSSSIYYQLSPYGGIRPAPRRRSRLSLTLSEREEISRGIVAQRSIRSMALLLGRSPSTVSREVCRNGEDRAVPGHWEGNLISGSKNSHIATLVERHTRYVMLVKVTSKETQAVVSALIK